MISVIIPAHNESTVIGRALQALVDGAEKEEIEIIVVCNGCTDTTAEVARSIEGPIQVVETDVASKTNALNIGDSIAKFFPRFYVDADLVYKIDDLRIVAKELKKDGIFAAAPEFEFDVSESSRAVKAYYRVWKRMPYFDTGRIAGAYGLSKEGRMRFEDFPEVVSDDGFVRLQFSPKERTTVKESVVTVKVPKNIKSLLRVKARSHGGVTQLRKLHPEVFHNETAGPC